MKRYTFCGMLSMLFILAANSIMGQNISSGNSLSVSSFNIRYSNQKDSINNWVNRKQWVADYILLFDLDIIGFQEVQDDQKHDLDKLLIAYKSVSKASDSNKPNGDYEACSIFYKAKRLTLLASGTFWLSDTPDRPSINWDSLYNRVCTWCKFRDNQTGKIFFHFNTHLPHLQKSEPERVKSVLLIKKKIWDLTKGKFPVMVTGDFNSRPDAETYNTMTEKHPGSPSFYDARMIANKLFAPGYTVNCFGDCDGEDGYIIDYIFTSRNVAVKKYVVVTEKRKGIYISDHYPVFCELRLEN